MIMGVIFETVDKNGKEIGCGSIGYLVEAMEERMEDIIEALEMDIRRAKMARDISHLVSDEVLSELLPEGLYIAGYGHKKSL